MSGFGGGAIGRAVVEILGQDAELKAVLAEDEAALKSFSRTGSSSMTGATKGAALAAKAINGIGIAAAGAVVGGAMMAATFEKTFAQIGSLAGKLGMPMDQAKQHVLDLAKATGQDPNGLASALYFAASAGLQASQVMPVLDASAKAAAMGMGDAQTVAQTLTSVLNAYKGTGLDTAGVMNIMTAAVKDGKAEMSDFATGLGPIISVAAAAGVSFQDMAAGLAEATNQGVPFARAVTGMRFLIQSLEAPGTKATTALQSIGLSADDVAKMLTQPGGLEKAIQLIHDRTSAMGSDGRAAWAAITGGARGAIVAVDLVGKHTADTNRIVADMGRSAQKGATDFKDAWGAISQTDAVKFQQAIAAIKVALIQLGEKALPLLTPLIGDLSALLSAVLPLAPAMLALWAAFKGVKALSAATTAVNAFGLAISAPELLLGIAGVGSALGLLQALLSPHKGLVADLGSGGDALGAFANYAIKTQAATDQMNAALSRGEVHSRHHAAAASDDAAATRAAGQSAQGAAGPTNALAAAHKAAAKAAQAQFLAETTLAGGLVGVESAASQVKTGEQTLVKLRAAGKQGTQAYSQAVAAQQQNVLALAGAVQQYQADNAKSPASTATAIHALEALGMKFGLTKGQIDNMAGAGQKAIGVIDGIQNKLNGLHDKTVNIAIVTQYHTIGSPPQPGKPLP